MVAQTDPQRNLHNYSTNGISPDFDLDALAEAGTVAPVTDQLTADMLAPLVDLAINSAGAARRSILDSLSVAAAGLSSEERQALRSHLHRLFKTGRDVDGFLESLAPPPGEPRFKPISWGEMINRPPKQWLIQDILGAGDVGVIYGAPGTGKTFVVLDLIMAACTGTQWAGRFDVERPLNVAYATGEGLSGLPQRLAAAAQHYGVDSVENVHFYDTVPQLFRDDDEGGSRFIRERRPDPTGMDLLVIDTLHAATIGGEENSSTDMGQVMDLARKIAKSLECAVLLIHHSDKAGRGYRGSTAIHGDSDLLVGIKRVSENSTKATMQCEKLKDGAEWKPQMFDLVAMLDSVYVSWDLPGEVVDGDGRKTETANDILELLGETDTPKTAKQIGDGIGKTQQAANKVLARLVKDGQVKRGENARGTHVYSLQVEKKP